MIITKSFTQFCNMWALPMPMITEEHLLRGTKIGKILRRELIKRRPDLVDAKFLDYTVQHGVMAWNAKQYVDRISIYSSVNAIADVYNAETVRSCMTGEGWKLAPFYHTNGIKIAVIQDSTGKILARSLVTATHYVETYGPSAIELECALIELGLEKMEEWSEHFTTLEFPAAADGVKYLPYLDGFAGIILKSNDQIVLTGITELDFEDFATRPTQDELDFVKHCVKRLEEFKRQSFQWTISSQQHAKPNDEGVHYVLDAATEAPIDLIIKQWKEYIEQIEEPEVVWYWSQRRINGRLYWLFNYWEFNLGWDWEDGYMDDYGEFQNRSSYSGCIDDVVEDYDLGEYGHIHLS